MLREIARDTVYKCTQGRFRDASVEPSTVFNSEDLQSIEMLPRYENDVKLEIVNEDTFVVCERLKEEKAGKSVCALNMASSYQPGGGWEKGSMAQEEELFRRSNYFKTLRIAFYPLKPTQVVYSPVVSIIKDQEYDDLRKPIIVSMIAAAAPKYPDTQITPDRIVRYARQQDYDVMQATIDHIFRVAYLKSHDVLVLGALGCGCYGNPPRDVIDMFNKTLAKYKKCFSRVVFAVYSKKDHNFQLFTEFLQVK